ncbi:MAG: DUF1667 domain-containing protein [Mesotoga sp.]|uniref:DUF1667 domain-containing protein n=1 Tax=unclassified Mesotoga TaxID=1184398 RepID=UPI000EF1A50D|nr:MULTISPECIES: DUF1667 domain-containing protein [unclassified Mesotoga]MDI9368287.1 DUF1667 domain-containing protein [Thermotogota bacterium]NLT46541.1 DUF1667 domain-containing protein [Thermotogaceae bacterium]MDD2333448.1 DUF1667 domain-containing protein [Mesotoga sp.]MDD3680239.1 DUF1667 domain-containing protein [Mesotoga sp.]MDD4206477.1 DUF1667 domain-containing protein [Mesotoga sp.]
MEGHITCVICPVGCRISVKKIGQEYSITGNKCSRGKEYALNELVMPKRILATSVKVLNGTLPLASAKTTGPIDRALILEKMSLISKIAVEAPVEIGDVLIDDIDGEGTSLVATRPVGRNETSNQ